MSAPVEGTSYAAMFLIPCSILFILAICTSVARLYSRIRPAWVLQWDDYCLVFALLLTSAWMAINYTLYAHGRGVQGVVIDPRLAGPLSVTAGIVWMCSLNVIRISMALMLLRLKDSRSWRWSLIGLIIIQICWIAISTSFFLAICRPLRGVWIPTPNTRCIPTHGVIIYGHVYNSFNIASDFFISLIPLTFIRRMHRSRSEKMLLAGLMAAGLCATITSVFRLAHLMQVINPLDATRAMVKMDLFCTLEILLLMIAANLPSLKAPTQRALARWRLVRPAKRAVDAGQSSFLERMTNGGHFAQQVKNLVLPKWEENSGKDDPDVTDV